jgi:ribose transport system ATP-binding protein
MNAVASSHQHGGGDTDSPRLQISAVSKTFGRQRVLDDVSLVLQPGELHALVGQNGSGKSTLVKILTGVYTPDAGARIEVDGISLGPRVQVPAMRAVGLSVVHQTLGLIEDATVLENIRIGKFHATRYARRIDWEHERAAVTGALETLGRALPLDMPVARLSAEERATVAIARALQDHSPGRGVIIFDESTRALRADAYSHFYDVVNTVRAAGASVLLISHRLEEVLEVSDRVTVLRDGRLTAAGVPTAELDESKLVRHMIGRDLRATDATGATGATGVATVAAKASGPEAPVAVNGLSGQITAGLSFEVRDGEVLGLTGLIGAGYEEVPYLLAGSEPAVSGTLRIGATSHDLATLGDSVRALARAGVALVPERRAEEGLAMDLSILDNITLPRAKTSGTALWLGRRWQRDETERMIGELGIRPPDRDAIVGTLSGGNQQKVLLAKWLAGDPQLLLLHEPTQAVDVSARQDIADAIRRAANAGCAVVVAGNDPHELATLCDRVLVLRNGAIAAELAGEFDEDAIVHATFGQPVRRGDQLRGSR